MMWYLGGFPKRLISKNCNGKLFSHTQGSHDMHRGSHDMEQEEVEEESEEEGGYLRNVGTFLRL